jgi:cytochrome c556
LRRGHELGLKTRGWRYPSAQWIRETEHFIELDRRLPRVLDGSIAPVSPYEWLESAFVRTLPAKRQHAAAARLSADAFAAGPGFANDLLTRPRYRAACSAVLAAAGQAGDAKNLPDKVSGGLRRQALLYLRADIALYAKIADGDQPTAKETVRQRLAHWQQDADLATVRDALDQLPETERPAWRQLWQDVEALRKRAAAPT